MAAANGTTSEIKPNELKLLQVLASWSGPGLPLRSRLAKSLDLSGESAVRVPIARLEERGYLEQAEIGEGNVPKVPQLTNKAREVLGLLPRPRVLDIRNTRLEQPIPVIPVSCGPLREAAHEPAYYVEYLGDIFQSYRFGDQLLFAEGDSMVAPDSADDSIFHGDRCLLRPDIWPGPGEVVLVEYKLDSGMRECTLKEWYQNEHTGLVMLKPRNPRYAVIERLVDEVTPMGVVMEFVRSMRPKRTSERTSERASERTSERASERTAEHAREIEYSNGHNTTAKK